MLLLDGSALHVGAVYGSLTREWTKSSSRGAWLLVVVSALFAHHRLGALLPARSPTPELVGRGRLAALSGP